MIPFQIGVKTVAQDANLRVLDEVLLGLSNSWALATNARAMMRNMTTEGHTASQVAIWNHYLASEEEVNCEWPEYGSYYACTPSSIGSEYDMTFAQPDFANRFSFGAFDMANPYLWDPSLLQLSGGPPKIREPDTGMLVDNGEILGLT